MSKSCQADLNAGFNCKGSGFPSAEYSRATNGIMNEPSGAAVQPEVIRLWWKWLALATRRIFKSQIIL
jgi:hypothetical protein